MEVVKEKVSAEFLEGKSTYLKMNRTKIQNLEKMIELLNKRKELLTSIVGDDVETLGEEYEQNEKRILLLKTDYDLAKHHKNRLGIEKESQSYTEEAIKIVTEMEDKWNEVIAKAKRDAVQKKDIGTILDSMSDVDFDENIDVKINYFLQLKSMVYNTGKPTLKKA